MIIKLQKPLFSTHGDADVLVYDERRTFTAQVPLTRRLDAMFGVSVKMYCEARMTEKRSLVVSRRIDDQTW